MQFDVREKFVDIFLKELLKKKIEKYNPFGTGRNFRDQIQVQLH